MLNTSQSSSRHRLYREHKFVTAFLNDFTRLIATADFTDDNQVNIIKESLNGRIGLMKGHAKHEDDNIHALLEKKGSNVHKDIEADHQGHDHVFSKLTSILDTIYNASNPVEKINNGHIFGLEWSLFEAQNLLHQYKEETLLMPALWNNCSDEELQEIDGKVYGEMAPNDMIEMMTGLFPYMNSDDHKFFLEDIKRATPNKFLAAFSGIAKAVNPITNQRMISENELEQLLFNFGVKKEQLEQSNPISQLGQEWGKRNPVDGGTAVLQQANMDIVETNPYSRTSSL